MRWLGGVLGAVLLATVLWDAFETIILRGGSAGGSGSRGCSTARRGSRGAPQLELCQAVGVTYSSRFSVHSR